MRTIQLFSAVFNMNNKKIGKGVMQRAEELHLILGEKSGFRKIKSYFHCSKQSTSNRYIQTNEGTTNHQ